MKLASKERCTGCAACYSACPKGALTMIPDHTGFLFPSIDEEKCVSCGLCEKACPVLEKPSMQPADNPQAYLVQHKNEDIRRQSTSGGAFTAIAEEIIRRGGVVFGASFEPDWAVRHTYAETVADLEKFRNSKYVQSEIRDAYKTARVFLEAGRWVCFSGTPCQINGLIKYLGRSYEKLITVDLVCHSVPSPLIFKKYMEYQVKQHPKVRKIVFRDKSWGYSYSTMALYTDSQTEKEHCIYRRGSESDAWFRAFLHGFCDRESCEDCQFQNWPRNSDITIWDCFTVSSIHKEYDDNKGTTSVIAWTHSGNDVLGSISAQAAIYEVDSNIFRKKINRESANKMTVEKQTMYLDANTLSGEDFINKYFPENSKIRLKRLAREMLYKSGLYRVVKRIVSHQ